MRLSRLGFLTAGAMFFTANLALAVTTYTETFNTDTANWRKNVKTVSLDYSGSGGPDSSGYVTTGYAFSDTASSIPALFRGHNEYDASGDAFVGNWQSPNGITHLTAYVRHNVPQPMSFILRVAVSANSPAVAFDLPVSQLVQPNTWTPIEFDVSFSNPLRTNEGANTLAFYNNVLQNVGNVQIGIRLPTTLTNGTSASTTYTYDLDNVTTNVPEPAGFLLMLAGVAGVGFARQRKR